MGKRGATVKGPFGLLLVGGGLILLFGLFTGKIVFPGASPPQTGLTPAQQAANRKTEGPKNIGTPAKNKQCPPGQYYVDWDGKCYDFSKLGI